MVKQKAKARVWCRKCGAEMSQYPFNILAFSCKKCGIKATVEYDKMPEGRALRS
jgi:Zn finger protein HypA/HybF involved in hydrogenase expression